MIDHISVEIKEFLIARFAGEANFDNLCRKIPIPNTFAGNYDARITALIRQVQSNFPDAIQRIYDACISLRPGFKDVITTLFAAESPPAGGSNGSHGTDSSHTNKPPQDGNGDKKRLSVFLSYSWKRKEIADEIDAAFQARSITLVRDIYDVTYKDDLTEFMKSIRHCDYAVTVLSDPYLKSPNCMFEIIELLKEQHFHNKILPIYLEDAKIFDPMDRIDYITYWNEKYKTLKAKAEKLDPEQVSNIAAQLKIYKIISIEIDEFMAKIGRMRLIPYNELKKNNFNELFASITEIGD